MEFLHALAQLYADQYSTPDDELLAAIAAQTNTQHAHAHMLSGQVQGRLLSMISQMIQPKRILEIGTFTGYSALCLAKGLLKDGQLHTIEVREADAAIARANFNRSNAAGKIILHIGNALNIIPSLTETWDLVFLDADKVHYIDYYRMVLPRLRSGGWILADNVLFHGQVLENPVSGKNAKAIQAFNEMVRDDEQVEQVLLTVRDGILLIRKK